jgi:hypothetical protein
MFADKITNLQPTSKSLRANKSLKTVIKEAPNICYSSLKLWNWQLGKPTFPLIVYV